MPKQVSFRSGEGALASALSQGRVSPGRDDSEDVGDQESEGLVYDESDSDDGGNAQASVLDADAAPAAKAAAWAPLLYKRPVNPADRTAPHCPPPMAGATLTAFPSLQKLVLFGGSADNTPNNDTWVYDMVALKWRQVAASADEGRCPAKRCGHGAAAVSDDEMVVFGGANPAVSQCYNDIWLFSLRATSWTRLDPAGTPPCARWHFAMAAVETRVIIHGGESSEYTMLADLHMYEHNPNAEFTADVPCSLLSSKDPYEALVNASQAISADASREGSGDFGKRGFKVVDVQVTAKPSASPSIAVKVALSVKRDAVDFELLTEAVADVLRIPASAFENVRPARPRWLPLKTVHPCPPPRMLHAAAVVSDILTITGGTTPHGVAETWQLQTRCLLWKPLPSIIDSATSPFHVQSSTSGGSASSPKPGVPVIGTLTGHVALQYDNALLVHGGKLNGKLTSDTIWRLDPGTGLWSAVPLKKAFGANAAKSDKLSVPSQRWKHAGCALVDMERTQLMRDARKVPLVPNPSVAVDKNEYYPLDRDQDASSLRLILAQERQELRTRNTCTGIVVSHGFIPHLTSTVGCVIWGGGTQ
eukprot:gene111-167_t